PPARCLPLFFEHLPGFTVIFLQAGTKFGWITAGAAFENPGVSRDYFELVLLNIFHGCLHLTGTELKEACDTGVVPAFQDIIQHVVHGNSRAGDLGAATAVHNQLRGFHNQVLFLASPYSADYTVPGRSQRMVFSQKRVRVVRLAAGQASARTCRRAGRHSRLVFAMRAPESTCRIWSRQNPSRCRTARSKL